MIQLKTKAKYRNHTVITLQSTKQEMSYLENCGEILKRLICLKKEAL